MTTRSPLTFLAGSALVLACACTPGVARGPAPLAMQGIELSPAEQAVERVMLRTGVAELVVESIAPAHAQATALAVNLGGRVGLLELQSRAATVTEIVEVERELARIQGELDSLQGRLAYLRDAASLSQLQLTLQRKVILGPLGVVAEKVGWVVEKLFVWRR